MPSLILALTAFVGTHLLLSHPLRAPLVARIGETGFMGFYSVVAFATLIWAVQAFQAAPVGVPLWQAGDVVWLVATVLMLLASVLFAGSVVGNPALPQPGAEQMAAAPARGVLAITRHPMMWSFTLWALVHALVSPRPAVLVLTSAIAVLALAGSAGQDSKKAQLMGDGWRGWQARTSFVPFANQLSGRTPWRDAMPPLFVMILGIALWLAASWAHPILGAPVAGIWRWWSL